MKRSDSEVSVFEGEGALAGSKAFAVRGLGCAIRIAVCVLISLALGTLWPGTAANAQTAPAARQIGTVKSVTPNQLGIVTATGQVISVSVGDGAKVLQLSAGSTDLKSAQAIKLDDIEVGDRVLVTGHADAPDALTASRVILMKSTDIAQKHAAEEEDWQKRGMGGLVSGVDTTDGTLTLMVRAKKIVVETSATTVFRRYANGSVKFEDAQLGTLHQIQAGDQLRVRGAKSSDGASIKAEEIVSGSFRNLAGTIVSLDAAAATFTIKDLASKKIYSIKVTPSSGVRVLPPEDAARFAAREKLPASGAPRPSVGASAGAASGGAPGVAAAGTSGGDLAQTVNRLPQGSLSELRAGEALIVVASQPEVGSDTLTAISVLSGVEPILAATPKGEASMTLSPWSLGGDGGGM